MRCPGGPSPWAHRPLQAGSLSSLPTASPASVAPAFNRTKGPMQSRSPGLAHIMCVGAVFFWFRRGGIICGQGPLVEARVPEDMCLACVEAMFSIKRWLYEKNNVVCPEMHVTSMHKYSPDHLFFRFLCIPALDTCTPRPSPIAHGQVPWGD